MAGERCNLGKDEAELLKPSSPSSTSPPNPAQTAPANAPSLFLSPPQEFLSQLTEKSEANNSAASPVTKPIKSDPSKEISPDFPSKKEISQESTKPAIGSTKSINRCSICSKRVGLTGFRCRCGDLFCGSHRYSDTHDCSFDYKAAGRAEILKNNPVIRAAKIIKI